MLKMSILIFWSIKHKHVHFNVYNFDLIDDHICKGAKIRNRYNQVPRLTQDTNGKVTNSQLDTTNESQEVSPFPSGDHKAQTLKATFKFFSD